MEESSNKDKGLVLYVDVEELRKLCLARAEAHDRRAKVYAKRTGRFATLVKDQTNETARYLADTADELLDDEEAPMPLDNGTVADLRRDVLRFQDGQRSHEMAARWLHFVTEHLPAPGEYKRLAFAGEGIQFLAYLADPGHPHAMPVHGHGAGAWGVRGVQ